MRIPCFNTFMLVYIFLKCIKLRVTLSLVGTFFGTLGKKIDTIGSLGDIENEVLVERGYEKICELFRWFRLLLYIYNSPTFPYHTRENETQCQARNQISGHQRMRTYLSNF
jgi:hypothetical protein